MMRRVLFLALVFLSVPTVAFKYLCNGMDADGVEEADQCGVCSKTTAPRWTPSTVDVLVDLKTLPPQVNEKEWKNEVLSGLQAWSGIPGTNLDLRFAGHSEHRAFGIDSAFHEIFWVLSKDEWRRKVGSGENGTLGVTVTPYMCPSSGKASREIYDADLIMNGAGKFKWRIDCTGESKCESIKSTLVHELGHFVGLGHPCTDCDWSIMSAAGGNELFRPLKDDQDGLRALYASGEAGRLGMRCDSAADCKDSLRCVEQNGSKFCAPACAQGKCPAGFACDEGLCRFATGRLAPPVGLRERCEQRVCASGLLCEETFSGRNFCVKPCFTGTDCPANEQCILYPDGGAGVCGASAGLDEVCGDFTGCSEKLVCVGKSETEGVCKTECEPRRKRCPRGLTCTSMGQDVWACI